MLKKYFLTIFSVLAITGCGGGSDFLDLDLYDYYGAVAINQNTGQGGIIANATSQKKANDEALKLCGSSCVVVLEFGPKKCGALARSESLPIFGWASDDKAIVAAFSAGNKCKEKGANDCKVFLQECNS